jgi:hypothetical protein
MILVSLTQRVFDLVTDKYQILVVLGDYLVCIYVQARVTEREISTPESLEPIAN